MLPIWVQSGTNALRSLFTTPSQKFSLLHEASVYIKTRQAMKKGINIKNTM